MPCAVRLQSTGEHGVERNSKPGVPVSDRYCRRFEQSSEGW